MLSLLPSSAFQFIWRSVTSGVMSTKVMFSLPRNCWSHLAAGAPQSIPSTGGSVFLLAMLEDNQKHF